MTIFQDYFGDWLVHGWRVAATAKSTKTHEIQTQRVSPVAGLCSYGLP